MRFNFLYVDTLCINRRTKLSIRVPKVRLDDMQRLTGQTLDLAGHMLQIGRFKPREFSPFSHIYSHFVDTGNASEELPARQIQR